MDVWETGGYVHIYHNLLTCHTRVCARFSRSAGTRHCTTQAGFACGEPLIPYIVNLMPGLHAGGSRDGDGNTESWHDTGAEDCWWLEESVVPWLAATGEGQGKKASSCAWRRFLGTSEEPAARQQCSASQVGRYIWIRDRSNCRIKDEMKCGQNNEPLPADHDAWENWEGQAAEKTVLHRKISWRDDNGLPLEVPAARQQ